MYVYRTRIFVRWSLKYSKSTNKLTLTQVHVATLYTESPENSALSPLVLRSSPEVFIPVHPFFWSWGNNRLVTGL